MIDALPDWFWFPASVLATVAWLALELRASPLIGPDHPEAITGLDVLERTGSHPG